MQNLSNLLEESDTVQTLRARTKVRQKWLEDGFFMVGNSLVRDNSVSTGALKLYLLLMSRLFQKDFSFPGQQTLAKEMNTSERNVRRFIEELKKAKWLKVQRRGLGKTNIYYLMKE